MGDTKAKFLTIVILTLVAGFIAWPSENKPGFKAGQSMENMKLNLGLDLQGGAWFRVRLKAAGLSAEEARKGTDDAMSVLTKRVNLRGLKEPRIAKVGGNEIQIEVPGLKSSQEVEAFKKVILSAGHLEFHIEADSADQAKWKQTGEAPPGTRVYEPRGTRGSNGGPLLCKAEVALQGSSIEKAATSHDMESGGKPAVSFEMTPEGARAFGQVTEANVGKQLAIILDDVLVSAPVIRSRISDHGQITGKFTEDEVKDIVTVLSSGALVAPLEMVGSSFIGPSLGQDAIDRGLKSCYFSLVIVMIFMLIYYRHAGMVANVAMIMNVTLLLGLLALLGATLTLPGIAGIVLTMGMAVDANIIVFERMREERDAGKTGAQCQDAGYERAFSAIVDGNLTTLLTGIILYFFGTGPIQGFAVTLSLGIITTLFTALTCSRVMMKLMLETGMVKEWTMMRAMSKPNIPFMKMAPKAAAISVVMLLVGIVAFFATGEKKYGIDFRGGVSLQMRFKKPTPIEDVRKGILDIAGEKGAKYPGAEVQSILLGADAGGVREAMQFQIRTLAEAQGKEGEDPEKFKEMLVADLRKQFAGKVPEPAVQVGQEKIEAPNPYAGGGTIRLSLLDEKPAKDTAEKIAKQLAAMSVGKPADAPSHYVVPLGVDGKPTTAANASTYEIWLMPGDFNDWNGLSERLSEKLKLAGFPLSGDPFPSVETVSASIVGELKEKAYIALFFAWIGIILYLAVRFDFKYGVAAVIALVHDSILAVTFTVLAGALIPKSWGIDLSLSLTTVAAALTVIGYSVNDTVIIYDRLRENLREVKSKGLSQVIDEALNQTLSRTIITSLTVFFVVCVLLVVTLTSGGGIAALALPMLIGVVVGTYSSVFIATPVLYWWRSAMKEKKA
ncbi:MAG: protein translocase subunit SecD [Planctomycetes bacterium]|nr:protein translocase subunit SecD [Planctomycetota bacterium]